MRDVETGELAHSLLCPQTSRRGATLAVGSGDYPDGSGRHEIIQASAGWASAGWETAV